MKMDLNVMIRDADVSHIGMRGEPLTKRHGESLDQ